MLYVLLIVGYYVLADMCYMCCSQHSLFQVLSVEGHIDTLNLEVQRLRRMHSARIQGGQDTQILGQGVRGWGSARARLGLGQGSVGSVRAARHPGGGAPLYIQYMCIHICTCIHTYKHITICCISTSLSLSLSTCIYTYIYIYIYILYVGARARVAPLRKCH